MHTAGGQSCTRTSQATPATSPTTWSTLNGSIDGYYIRTISRMDAPWSTTYNHAAGISRLSEMRSDVM